MPKSWDDDGDWALPVQMWCRKHGLPRIHGCIWDRHCREWAKLPRISLMWRGHMWYVDLPGWYVTYNFGYNGLEGHGRHWNRLHFGHHYDRRFDADA